MSELEAHNRELWQAILEDNVEKVSVHLERQRSMQSQSEMERVRLAAALEADPLNPALQAQLQREIDQANVQGNMEMAMEYDPAVFGSVQMLFIPAKVNQHSLVSFIDCGAQTTIISKMAAERCGLLRLMDTRFSGVARGVGTGRILGRIHTAELQIGASHFSSSFTVIENQDQDVLLGLDMLRKHQCVIDLRNGVLRIGPESVPFLSESEIPQRLRGGAAPEAESEKKAVPGPDAEDKEKIAKLVALGFSQQSAEQALKLFAGDADRAAALLFEEGGLGF